MMTFYSCGVCGALSHEVCRVGCGAKFKGILNDSETEVTPEGGRHTKLDTACELLPPSAVLQVSKVLKEGAEKRGVDNWRKISRSKHLGHALTHIFKYMTGDKTEDHLVNAACRLLFSLETM